MTEGRVMRTLRLSLVGTVIVVLLGGLSGSALAQDDSWPKVEKYVVFGDDDPDRQYVHIYMPEPRQQPRPALIFFHGGALEVGITPDDATPFGDLAAGGGLGEPYVTFLAGYRLLDQATGEVRWPAQLHDAQRVVRWVRAHADEYNVDPDRVCAVGDSSGGHLAAMLGVLDTVDDSDPELAGISSRVQCVITTAGNVDLTIPEPGWLRDDWYEAIPVAELEADPNIALQASPFFHVDEDTVPMLVLHGNRDDVVPIESSRNLADALGAAGIEYVYAELPTGHGVSGILSKQATWELAGAFLRYQVHPEQ
jgi:acetyl esterase/lipase